MRVLITGFPDGKKIHAIKAIRAATHMGLKEAKDVADRVSAGNHTEIDFAPAYEGELAGYVDYYRLAARVSNADLIDILERYPEHMIVGDLIHVLKVVRDAEATYNATNGNG